MAVLTHLNPPCWKWIWHMRNEDFGSYSAHLNHYTDRFVTFKNIYINTARIWKLKCWYLRLNVVSFEIERRSNGSLKIKSIVTEIERVALRKNTTQKYRLLHKRYFSTTFPASVSSDRKYIYRQNRKCGRSTFVLGINKVTLIVGPFCQLLRRRFCIFLTVTNNLQMFLTRKKRLDAEIRAKKRESVSVTITITEWSSCW